MVRAFLYYMIPGKVIVILGKRNETNSEGMLNIVNKNYSPFSSVIFNDGSEKIRKLDKCKGFKITKSDYVKT